MVKPFDGLLEQVLRRALPVGALVILVAMLGPVAAAAQTEEEQARQIARELQCPVCQGLSVADSTSELATQMRAIIRERLRAGESRDSIMAYFVARYGDSILIAPPRTGVNALIWVAPYLGVVLGVGLLVWRLRGRRRATSAAGIGGGPEAAEEHAELAPYYQEVDRALDQLRDRPVR